MSQSTAYLEFQFRFDRPFNNLDVRKAVEYAINRKQINQVVNDGQGEVASQPFPEQLAGLRPFDGKPLPLRPGKGESSCSRPGRISSRATVRRSTW